MSSHGPELTRDGSYMIINHADTLLSTKGHLLPRQSQLVPDSVRIDRRFRDAQEEEKGHDRSGSLITVELGACYRRLPVQRQLK